MDQETEPNRPLLSVVVPARNERENLRELLSNLRPALVDSGWDWELIIVDDNSSDGTSELIDRESAADPRIKAVHRRGNPGFGLAIKEGLAASRGEYVVPFMADLSDDPSDLIKLVRKGVEGFDIAYGSRFMTGGGHTGYPSGKLLANRTYNHLAGLLFGLPRKDITNALKCYRREVLEAIGIETLVSDGFEITLEIPLRAHILGFSSVEVPVTWNSRKRGKSGLSLRKNGPAYVKRLVSIFIRGNVAAVGELFGETVKISRLRLLGSLALGIAMLSLMFLLLDTRQIASSLRSVFMPIWLLACASIFVSFLFRTWRWSVLLRSAGRTAKRDVVYSTLMFGWLVNYVLPARVGDLARALVIRAVARGGSASIALSTILVERFFDVLVISCAFVWSTSSLGTGPGRGLVLAALAVLLVLLAGILALRFSGFLVPRLPSVLRRFGNVLESMSEGVGSMLGNRKATVLSGVLSIPVWFLEISTLYFAAAAVGVPISFSVAVLAATSAFVLQSVPVTPAGIGVHEATITGVLGLFEISGPEALAVAVVDHLARGAVIYLFGLVSTVHLALIHRRSAPVRRVRGD